MSKGQKQRTNEKRDRRLGSGQGIASSSSRRPAQRGGIPLWAWLVSGSVIVAAVVVAVVLVSRGSSAASGGQSASCVQARLSHATLDPLSQPTWPANYSNLPCALDSLGLQPSAEQAAITHYHAHLTLYVNGKKVLVPVNIGLQNPPAMSSDVHTHDQNVDPGKNGIIHVESPTRGFHATLLQFFDVWGVYATGQCLGGYCDGVKVWVNGKPAPAGVNSVMHEHDAFTMVVGKQPQGFKPDTHYTFEPGE
ncbi:MAG: hypothetical protein ACTHNU_02840 [Gaiellales bacterium]